VRGRAIGIPLATVIDALRSRLGSPPSARRLLTILAIIAGTIGIATAVVAVLESSAVGLADASPVYFVAVVFAGSLIGPWAAVATAIGSFVVYDLLFTQPTFTIVVSNPQEWLDLVLFLVLAVIVGRLSALGREQADEASRRASEATALFAISRILATEQEIETAAPQVAERLVADGSLDRVWIVRDRPGGPLQPLVDGAGIVIRDVAGANAGRCPGPLGRRARTRSARRPFRGRAGPPRPDGDGRHRRRLAEGAAGRGDPRAGPGHDQVARARRRPAGACHPS
jgi:hypothetical protein